MCTMDCFEAPRMGLNLIFIKVSAAPTGALGPWRRRRRRRRVLFVFIGYC